MLPSRSDQDGAWALKVPSVADESDDGYSFVEEEEYEQEAAPPPPPEPQAAIGSGKEGTHASSVDSAISASSRERRPSFPLSKSISSSGEPSPKHHLKDLVKIANEVAACDPEDIAQEITRQWVKRFLGIKPRDWLHYVFIGSKKAETDPITAFNVVSNHLADWCVYRNHIIHGL